MRCNFLTGFLAAVAAGAMVGCSTPKHTNTLIFGTTTRFALDASQDPTGTVGVTIGYKRQEAVWMPLLANKDENLVPAECKSEDCPKFLGAAGAGGPAGNGASDTYSVLATLSGQTSASAGSNGAQGGGGIAQVFATGIAARLLAVSGGAALVNSAAHPTDSDTAAAIMTESRSKLMSEKEQITALMACVGKDDGTVDSAKLTKLVDGAAGNDADKRLFTQSGVAKLKGYTAAAKLNSYLADFGSGFVPPLHAELKKSGC
jgi:hypothetical protein